MRYGQKTKMSGVFIGAGAMSVILIATIGYYQFFKISDVENRIRNEVKSEKQRYGTLAKVVVAGDNLKQGQAVDAGKLIEEEMPVGFIPQGAVDTKAGLGQRVPRIDIAKGTVLSDGLLVEPEKMIVPELRTQDFFNIKKFYALKKGDVVDIRLKRADGTDEVVAAKKQIIDIVNGMVSFNIIDTERLNLNYATVECLASRGEMYTTLYVDPINQPAAPVTYAPNQQVLNMVRNNPDVVEQAKKTLAQKEKEVEAIVKQQQQQPQPPQQNNQKQQ